MDHHHTEDHSDSTKSHSSDYAPYPKLDPTDIAPPPPNPNPNQEEYRGTFVMGSQPEPEQSTNKPASVSENLATTMPSESNPYVSSSPAPSSSLSVKEKMDSVRDVFGKWGKKVGEATKKAEDLAGNVWQHLCAFGMYLLLGLWSSFGCKVKTGPSVADAAMGRIAQGTKVLAEGGYEKIFRQTFETVPEEQLQKSYACYLSTSAGPVMGTLYTSTAKLAFCSDNPLSYKVGDQTEWSYYKVVIPLHQLKAVNPSTSKVNPAEKYIQVISSDNHEFWFMGFVNYDSAVKSLQEVVQARNLQSV
ncbi:hypothetical protein HHK36_008154 [Tetracentron sinense]|uniref:GRAM domain-containing protein n=1 Tax=Tetracentron sinense TaxID=13715 RepID=A0A834ZEC2_TETSI|nr:hypothetical protein HHK36_008154 [Tetracentron sinense]